MKVFLDANIIIDFLADRGVFTGQAKKLFATALSSQNIGLTTSTHALATTFYILNKLGNTAVLKNTLLRLTELVEVLDVTRDAVVKALLDASFTDFEDGIQFHTARSQQGIDFIITRNLKDFSNSTIPAISVDEFLLRYGEK